jgi:putative tricarboxylic transport membrane protein
MKLNSEKWFMVIVTIFLGLLVLLASKVPSRGISEYDVGTNVFPVMLSVMMLVISIVILFLQAKKTKTNNNHKDEKKTNISNLEPVLYIVISFVMILFYVLILDIVGFEISTIIFLVIMNLFIDKINTGKFMPLKYIFVRIIGFIIFTLGLTYVFEKFFGLILP